MKKILLIILLFIVQYSFSQSRYWVAAGAGLWSGNNWSSTSGGAADGGGPPTGAEDAFFDGNGLGNCTVDAVASFNDLTVDGYTAIIDINGNSFTVNGEADLASGTISDTPGTSELTISSTDLAQFSGTLFNAEVNCTASRIDLDGSTFNADFTGIKVGAFDENGDGGNVYNGNFTLSHHANGGRIRLGVNVADTYNGNVTLNNRSRGQIEFADNSAGNVILGDLIINLEDTSANVIIADGSSASLSIGGNLTITHNSTSNSNCYIGNNGDVNLTGNFVYTNTSSGNSNSLFVASTATSSVTIGGTSSISNNSTTSSTSSLYLGRYGAVTFNDELTLTLDAVASNSYIYLNHETGSSNIYNGNILLNCNNATSDGIYFGNAGGDGTLTTGFTVSVGGSGFSTSRLIFRNFTQVGGTAQALNLTGTARLDIITSTFEADLSATAARIYPRESVFEGEVDFVRSGTTTDDVYGGNRFEDLVSLTNAGSERWLFANNLADTFLTDVTLITNGSDAIYLADAGGTTSIGGDLNIIVTGNGTNVIVANVDTSALTIAGDLNITNNSAGNSTIYIGNGGSVTVGGDVQADLTGTGGTCRLILADNETSFVDLNGKLKIDHSGGTNSGRILLANEGDLTIADSVIIENASAATSSEVFVGSHPTSVVQLNGSVVISVNDAATDGFFFGNDNSDVTLAAGQTLTIGTSGFDNGELSLASFNQLGGTAQNLTLTGTAVLDIDSSNFTGAVNFSAPRLFTDNTTYSQATTLSKTGATTDDSGGGNKFQSDLFLNHSGTGDFRFGNNYPDSVSGNFTINHSGTAPIYFARSAKNNYVAGDLNYTNTASSGSPNFYLTGDTSSSITINGLSTLNINTTGTATNDTYFPNSGDATFNSNVSVTNSSSTTSSTQFWVANSQYSEVLFNGDLTIVNGGSATEADVIIGQGGEVTIDGNVDIDNDNSSTNADLFFANQSTSSVQINGDVDLFNEGSGTNRNVYYANYGSVTTNGVFSVENSSNASSSNIFIAYRSSGSTIFNDNIILEATDTNNDNISFGGNDGVTTLSAGNTISIGAGGFIGGNLTFRNFTQVGATAQNIAITGSGIIYHYDADWGGDASFEGPRIRIRTSTFNGDSEFTKTSTGSDDSYGGNIFEGNTTFNINGNGRFYMGSSQADTFNLNVTYTNASPGGDFELANNSANNYIAGDLTISHTPTGGDSYVILARSSSSSIQIDGATIVNSGGTPSNTDIYLGYQGDVTFNDTLSATNAITAGTSECHFANGSTSNVIINGNVSTLNNGSGTIERHYIGDDGLVTINGTLDAENNGSSTTADIFIADATSSVVSITGIVDADNNASGTNARLFFGNNGDVTFGSQIEISNNSGAGNSEVSLNRNSNSANTYNGPIVVENTNATADGVTFGINGGSGTIAAAQSITIGAGGFNAGDLEFRNFTRTGVLATNLACTGTARIYSYDSEWQGDVSFTAPQFITRGSTYAGLAYFEKTGATDNVSVGGNTFNDNVTFVNSGSGYLLMGNGTFDSFGANVTTQNTGSRHIYLAYSGAGHTITGDLIIENNGTSGNTNTYISDRSSATLSIGGNVSITNNGTSTNNDVYFGEEGDITVGGEVDILSTGTATNSEIYVGYSTNSTIDIGADLTAVNAGGGSIKRYYMPRGGDLTVGGNLSIDNSASATTASIIMASYAASQVTINGTADFTNSGTGNTSNYSIANQGDIIFEGDVTATNSSGSGDSFIRFSQNSNASSTFNGSITLENSNAAGDGVTFGSSGGVSTLADGETISIGGGGFVAGNLQLRNFTQNGLSPQSITTTGTSRFYTYDASFDADLTVVSPRFYLRTTTFNGDFDYTKTGSTNESSYGGNTFEGDVSFTITGTGYQRMANNVANDYNGDLSLIQSGSGYLRPAYNRDCTLEGDLYYDFTSLIRFGDANGSLIFDGTTNQSINDLGASTIPYFEEMVVNKSAGELTLNTPIIIANDLTLTDGLVNTDFTNTLTFLDNSSVTATSNESHVVGPVNKIGNDAFNFPVGNGIQYRPIGIARVTSGSAEFQASYIDTSANASYSIVAKEVALDHISREEYWILDRLATTAQADVILSWDTASGGVDNLSELRVARWDGAQWTDEGNSATTGNTVSGTVTSLTRVTDFSPFTLASSTANNPLPVELISFEGQCLGNHQTQLNWATATEVNNDYFTIYASTEGFQFIPITTIKGHGNSLSLKEYTYLATGDYEYYYLSQTDFDGTTKNYPAIHVQTCADQISFSMYPNPLIDKQLIIEGSDQEQELIIRNTQGKVIYQTFFVGKHQLNAQLFSNGVYFVSLRNGEEVETQKLFVK